MELELQLQNHLGKAISEATREELYAAVLALVKEKTAAIPTTAGNRKLYYISAEFLVGKQLGKNLINLGIYEELNEILAKHGQSLEHVEDFEQEPSLGNGGLGRLAACFLDSIATLQMSGDGIGLRYHYGLFKQEFKDRKQFEVPDAWLSDVSCLEKTDVSFPIELAGKTYHSRMYNLDVIGYQGGHNRLRLFDLDTIDESIVTDGINFDKTDIAKNLTLFLYPDDSERSGQLLRVYQQYFMVSNAAQFILQEEKEKGHDLRNLDHHVAIQINDTHPSMVIPELIRLLIKEGILLKDAIRIVKNTCAYTNHTILAEALEKWPVEYLNEVVPQLMPIIGALDYAIVCGYHNNENLNIIDQNNRVHMARIDMHFGHSINGVAALHTEILKHQELKPFYDIYGNQFNNKTNGITFRRWIMHCNRKLSAYLDKVIGSEWHTNAMHLEKLLEHYNNQEVLNELEQIKFQNKIALAKFIKEKEGVDINPHSIFDIQVKRMHEYKRQQMNALWVIHQYLCIKNGQYPAHPITVFFGGKAAPAYYMAKNIIHLILCLQELINHDPEVSPWLKVVMMKNYNVAKSERVIPAADISEQISLASKEASGTGNMKFMLNGAITLGTADGANVEIAQLVGHDNIYEFGRSSDEVIHLYNTNGYHSYDFYNDSELIRNAVNFITSPELTALGDYEMLSSLKDNLIHKDWFMTLLDLEAYCQTKQRLISDYANREKWKRMVLVNIAKAGFFSSDRTINDYNHDIWHLK